MATIGRTYNILTPIDGFKTGDCVLAINPTTGSPVLAFFADNDWTIAGDPGGLLGISVNSNIDGTTEVTFTSSDPIPSEIKLAFIPGPNH